MSGQSRALAILGLVVGCGGHTMVDTAPADDGDTGFDDGLVNISDATPREQLRDVAQLALGRSHTCALRTDGTVACWGNSSAGQLGDGVSTTAPRPTPQTVPRLSGVTEISSGNADETCARLTSGTVKCWGPATPTAVASLSDVAQIAVGAMHKCARLTDGTVKCWGYNFFGELGDGTTSKANRPLPTTVVGLSDSSEIAAGFGTTCARRTDGTVSCWGWIRIGDEPVTMPTHLTPTTVLGLTDVLEVAVGMQRSCARLSDGTVKCWGGSYGSILSLVPGLSGVTEIALQTGDDEWADDQSYRCVRLVAGAVECWGRNPYGQLGDGTTTTRDVPAPVPGLPAAAEIAVSHAHTCARLTDGTVRCWGDNSHGQLGDGTTTNRLTPTPVTW